MRYTSLGLEVISIYCHQLQMIFVSWSQLNRWFVSILPENKSRKNTRCCWPGRFRVCLSWQTYNTCDGAFSQSNTNCCIIHKGTHIDTRCSYVETGVEGRNFLISPATKKKHGLLSISPLRQREKYGRWKSRWVRRPGSGHGWLSFILNHGERWKTVMINRESHHLEKSASKRQGKY